jgi:predicted 3-demethylubiquinone-9 3-methyltransferase (glyoxalase superfamily)
MPSQVSSHLWFDDQAEEAARFYVSLIKNSKVTKVSTFPGPDGKSTISNVEFVLDGQQFIGLNAGPQFKLDEAFSIFIKCDSQEEVDAYWSKLTADGGKPGPCGWLTDRFGVSWQIVPRAFLELATDRNRKKAKAVLDAMYQMSKLDLAKLQQAYDDA